MLLLAGAEPGLRDRRGRTPLHLTAKPSAVGAMKEVLAALDGSSGGGGGSAGAYSDGSTRKESEKGCSARFSLSSAASSSSSLASFGARHGDRGCGLGNRNSGGNSIGAPSPPRFTSRRYPLPSSSTSAASGNSSSSSSGGGDGGELGGEGAQDDGRLSSTAATATASAPATAVRADATNSAPTANAVAVNIRTSHRSNGEESVVAAPSPRHASEIGGVGIILVESGDGGNGTGEGTNLDVNGNNNNNSATGPGLGLSICTLDSPGEVRSPGPTNLRGSSGGNGSGGVGVGDSACDSYCDDNSREFEVSAPNSVVGSRRRRERRPSAFRPGRAAAARTVRGKTILNLFLQSCFFFPNSHSF